MEQIYVIDVIQDLARQKLNAVPRNILLMCNLKMLYLEDNQLQAIPEELFTLLGKLVWLDLSNNHIKQIPRSIAHHSTLETLLLGNNRIESLPMELGLVPNLKDLHLKGNPIAYPKKSIIQLGTQGILLFLRDEYNNVITDDVSSDFGTPRSLMPPMSEQEPPTTVTTPRPCNQSSLSTIRSFNRFRKYRRYKQLCRCSSSKYCTYKEILRTRRQYRHMSSMKSLQNYKRKYKDYWGTTPQSTPRSRQKILEKKHDKVRDKNIDNYHLKSDYQMSIDTIESPRSMTTNMTISSPPGKRQAHPQREGHRHKQVNVETLISDIVETLKRKERARQLDVPQIRSPRRELKMILELQRRLSALKIRP